MIGKTYGRLTVLTFSHYSGKHRQHFLCRCVCGTEKTVQATLLRNGNTKSCGCLATETRRATRLPAEAGVINQIILQYKRHARDRGIEWDLPREDVDRLVRMECHYCGVVGGNTKRTKNHAGFKHNGIDRVDSSRGYHPANVVACCGPRNRAKRDTSREAFVAWACRIAAHQKAMADQWGAAATERLAA